MNLLHVHNGMETIHCKLLFDSATESQLLVKTLFCVVLSSTGKITADTLCIWVIHKII